MVMQVHVLGGYHAGATYVMPDGATVLSLVAPAPVVTVALPRVGEEPVEHPIVWWQDTAFALHPITGLGQLERLKQRWEERRNRENAATQAKILNGDYDDKPSNESGQV